MTSTPIKQTIDTELDPQQEYRALLRSIRYTEGFGLLFIQCSPAEGVRLIERAQKDLPEKHIIDLSLTEPIENLYEKVDSLSCGQPIDVLFIRGIEYSLYEYEKNRLWNDDDQRLSYSETGVPQLLQHLNLNRERFHDEFPFHFAFLVPQFALKYLIRRSPDFFDWQSGVLEFPMAQDELQLEFYQLAHEEWNNDFWNSSTETCRERLLKLKALLDEPFLADTQRANLFFNQGNTFTVLKEWEEAIISFEKSLKLDPDNSKLWHNKGMVLNNLGRQEEAIESFNNALQLVKFASTYFHKGIALRKLGRYEEATADYDKALELESSNQHEIWNEKGISLQALGRYKEAIDSHFKASEIKKDDPTSWLNLRILLELDGNSYKQGEMLQDLGRHQRAIVSFDKVLSMDPKHFRAWYRRGISLNKIQLYSEAVASYDKAIEFKPDYSEAWTNRGNSLGNLGRYDEAILSYGKAIELDPNNSNAFYSKARSYAIQLNLEGTITNLSQAIALKPGEYRALARQDPDFNVLRGMEAFEALISEP
jgi:tetratricopeptide (TPR) repeat protein